MYILSSLLFVKQQIGATRNEEGPLRESSLTTSSKPQQYLGGFVELLGEIATDPSELDTFKEMAYRLSEMTIDEINAQRELNAAVNSELSANPAYINSLKLLEEIADLYKGHEVAQQRHIRTESGVQKVTFTLSNPSQASNRQNAEKCSRGYPVR